MNGFIVMKKHKTDGIVIDQDSYLLYDEELSAQIVAAMIDEAEGEYGATGVVVPVHRERRKLPPVDQNAFGLSGVLSSET